MPQVNPEVFHGKHRTPPTIRPSGRTCLLDPLSSSRASLFIAKVYDITRMIPHGRVTSYGHIAKLTGHPSHSRLVGSALKFLQDPTVPWHRVISSSGAIAGRGDGGEAAARQAQWLQEEGVTIIHGRGEGVTIDFGHANPNAKYKVSMSNFGWFPDYVHLEGYGDDDDAPQQEVERDDKRHQGIKEEEDGSDSELSELTDED